MLRQSIKRYTINMQLQHIKTNLSRKIDKMDSKFNELMNNLYRNKYLRLNSVIMGSIGIYDTNYGIRNTQGLQIRKHDIIITKAFMWYIAGIFYLTNVVLYIINPYTHYTIAHRTYNNIMNIDISEENEHLYGAYILGKGDDYEKKM